MADGKCLFGNMRGSCVGRRFCVGLVALEDLLQSGGGTGTQGLAFSLGDLQLPG